MALFVKGKQQPKTTLEPEQTRIFSQARSYKGFRRVNFKLKDTDNIEKNVNHFRKNGFDFSPCTIQVKIANTEIDPGKCLKIYVDNRHLGTVYRSGANAEAFNAVLDNKIDKAYVKLKDIIIDGEYYGTDACILFHWPNMGPKVSVAVK